MKRKIISLCLILGIVVNCFSTYTRAEDSVAATDQLREAESRTAYIAVTMQGNTDSASDWKAFEDGLAANGYLGFGRMGWATTNTDPYYTELQQRVTVSGFRTIGNYHVAYYSGHGGSSNTMLNATSSNSCGTSSPFNAAEALGVKDDNGWQSSCIIGPSDNIRVLMLAACFQLNDANVKYYARLMRASGIRVIAGYTGMGPGSNIDMDIANDFIADCENGDSIRIAWDNANERTYKDWEWAVLVYHSNGNQDYRLPGFPGTTYAAPASGATVYRYIQGMGNQVYLNTNPSTNELETLARSLPQSIEVTEVKCDGYPQKNNRDSVWSEEVHDNEELVVSLLGELLGENVADNPRVQYQVSRTEIDPELGPVPESEVVVERTYKYYDTYSGIKIVDSFISASVDGEGVNRIRVNRKQVVGDRADGTNLSSPIATAVISIPNAYKAIVLEHSCIAELELLGTSLAYVPDGSGRHVLCYEFQFSGSVCYVNVHNGSVVQG